MTLLLALAACGGGGGGGGDSNPPPGPGPSANALNVTITDAFVDEDDHAVVQFLLTDGQGVAVSSEGVQIRLVIAALAPDGEYRSYLTTVQTSPDTGAAAVHAAAENATAGTLATLDSGFFEYRFANPLPAGFDRDASHRIGIYADTSILEVAYVSNATFDFVPSGQVAVAARDVVRTETCNGCHDPLEAHGGSRRSVALCVVCHSTEITDFATGERSRQIDPDSGNGIGFPEMIHKIHRGENLPSVEAGTPYEIVGFRQTVFDFSHVVFPQDIRNCETCHRGAADAAAFQTRLSRNACGSCHDDVNFASGANHGGGPQDTDGSCSACHLPATGQEFDLSVAGSHVIPAHSTQAAGVRFEIVRVESAETGAPMVAPGEHARVTFRVTTAAGDTIVPTTLNSLSLTLAGPTVDYAIQDYDGDGVLVPGDPSSPWTPGAETFKSESLLRAALEGPDESGAFTYELRSALPPDATGTYAIGIEGYRCATISGASQRTGGTNCSGTRDPNGNGREDPGEVFDEVRDVGPNRVFYFPVTDAEAVPRRMPVATDQCSACHGVFSKDFNVHGGNRNDVQYCPLCHNPSNDTLSRQLPPIGEPATTSPVDFKIMIHKIHRGEDLTTPYVLFGRPSGTFPDQRENAVDFGEVVFPGDLRNCEACHLPETYVLEPGRGLLGPEVGPPTTRDFVRNEDTKTVLDERTTPITIAVCTSCHDDVNLATGENHAAGPQPEESCVGCHGVGRQLSVERTHFPGLPPEARILRPN